MKPIAAQRLHGEPVVVDREHVQRLGEPGTLYLWAGSEAGSDRARMALGRRPHLLVEGCLRVPLAAGALSPCSTELSRALTPEESREVRALFIEGDAEPQLGDFVRLTTLRALDVLLRARQLLAQLAEGRITSHFHPIVHADDTGRIFGHEALLRGLDTDGSLHPPLPILDLAREAGLLLELDLAACRSAVRQAALYRPPNQVFINFSPAMGSEPQESLRAIVEAVDEAGLDRARVVFEVTEADRIGDVPQLARLLDGYRREGFRVALDDLGAGWSTLTLLHRVRPDFIKLDRELISGIDRDPVKGLIAGKLLEIGRGMGIRTIVEGVENRAELEWVRQHGAEFVQGFLFGMPAERPAV
jgi:EAL domain-containing protein (putative c-di-GMP-specific phosphodiesterase class I)